MNKNENLSREGSRKGSQASQQRSQQEKSEAAKKGWDTRREEGSQKKK